MLHTKSSLYSTIPHVQDVSTTTELASSKTQLLQKIQSSHQTMVAVVGLGYVGLPLAVCVAKVGYTVVGMDISEKRVQSITAGKSYIDDVTDAELAPFVNNHLISASTSFELLAQADIIIICVPTPLTKNRDPDTSYIQKTTETIAQYLRPGQLISLESTTYPGTTEDLMLPILEKTGLSAGKDFFLAFSPERVDPGNARYTTHNTNKVVGGVTPACTEVACAFYRKIILEMVPVSSPSCAEMVKVFENTFRAVNIALVNELTLLCDRMGLNVWEVLEAAATKPFGIMPFYPGPGVGGHCIPIDPFYLTWKAREYNFHTRFIELAGEINSFMPQFVREKIIRALGKRGKPVYGSRILLLGMAYKRDLRDWRHSPSLDLWHVLQQDEAQLLFHDPFVPEIEENHGKVFYSQSLNAELLGSVDCVVLMTDHTCFDFHFLYEHSPIIVDTRNAFRSIVGDREKVILL